MARRLKQFFTVHQHSAEKSHDIGQTQKLSSALEKVMQASQVLISDSLDEALDSLRGVDRGGLTVEQVNELWSLRLN